MSECLRQKSASSAAAGSTPCPDSPTSTRSASKRPSARPLTPSFSANSRAARSLSSRATAAAIASCPPELNFRANIYAFKKLGVERILSVSAVGSLKEEHKPTDFVMPDQFIDRTFHRVSTFFGDGIVGHVAFGDPVCATVAKAAADACATVGVVGKLGGTYVCMEGPQFSTRAESNLYRSWGADVIGMTNLQEAKLAREAEICYATIAMVTDYDCWREGHDAVTIEEIVAVLHQNADNAAKVVKAAVAAMPPTSKRPNLRLRLGRQVRRAHAARRDSRGGKRETEAALREVSWVVGTGLSSLRIHVSRFAICFPITASSQSEELKWPISLQKFIPF